MGLLDGTSWEQDFGVWNETKTMGDDEMTKFNIENLEGKGIKAEVLDGGQHYSSYYAFAEAAGHPEAVFQNNPIYVSVSHLEGNTVDVIAVGDHEREREGKLYICRTDSGQKFIIGHKGVKIIEQPKLSEFSTDALYKEIERRAFEAGFKAAKERYKDSTPVTLTPVSYQPSRGRIVEQAKNDVKELEERGLDHSQDGGFVGNDTYKYNFYTVEFQVNAEKRTVVALIRKGRHRSGEVDHRGIAKCDPDDCFNEFIGKAIALHRALGLDVPTDYLNAPEPEGKQHGDIVSFTDWSLSTRIIRLIDHGSERLELGKTAHVGSAVSKEGRVINDTARYK